MTWAYVPFLDPIHGLHSWWCLLLLPLALGISVIYRALKMPDLTRYWRSVSIMTVQIVGAMAALAVVLVVLVEVVIPWLPGE